MWMIQFLKNSKGHLYFSFLIVCVCVYGVCTEIVAVIAQCSFLIKMWLLLFVYGLFKEFTTAY